MGRYFLEVAYKGTRYSGFQVQENAVTIQSEIEKALAVLHRMPFTLTGSSRTDAGVHALQNFFHFDAGPLHPQALYKLNAILPPDIVVQNLYVMPDTAHSRFDAIGRQYEYRIHQRKDPFARGVSLFFPYKLNTERMERGAELIAGQTNFFAFSKTNTQVRNFECTVHRSEWIWEGDHFKYCIEGNRFLRGMVRLLTATLLKLGREKLTLDQLEQLFNGKGKAGLSVPSDGLFLKGVIYPPGYLPVPG